MTQPAPIPEPAPAAASTPAPEGTVAVLDRGGRLGHIPIADLGNAQQQGFVIASPERVAQHEADSKNSVGANIKEAFGFGGGESQVGALRAGVRSGATVGLSRLAEQKLAGVIGPILRGGTSEEWEQKYTNVGTKTAAAYPTTTSVGEGIGMVGGTLATGGIAGELGVAARAGSGLAKAGSIGARLSPLALIGEAGEGAAAAARGLTSGLRATGAAGRALAAGAELGARGAIETGLYSGVHEMSEEMLGKPELNAEKIFAAAADGAQGGALFGSVLGAGGSLAASGYTGLKGLATDVISKNADGLSKLADAQRWRTLDPLKKFTKEAEARVPGGTNAVGETLGRYGITGKTFEEARAAGDVGSIATKLDEAVEKVGSQLGDLTAASDAQIKFGAIDDAFEKTIAPLRKKALHENIVRSLEEAKRSIASQLVPETEQLATRAGASMTEEELAALTRRSAELRDVPVSIQDALFQRKAIDQIAYKESKALDPKLRVEFLRDIRRNFEDVIVSSFDDAARAAGTPGKTAELLQLKKDYQALSLAQSAATDSTARMATNRNISLSDYMAGGFASHIGTAVGGVLGPVGAGLGGLAGGAVGSALNRFGRSKGNALAAVALDHLSGMAGKVRGAAAPLVAETAPRLGEGLAAAARPAEEAIAPVAAVEPELPSPALRAHGPLPEQVEAPTMAAARPRPSMPDVGPAPVRPESGPMPELAAHDPYKPSSVQGRFEDRINDAIHYVSKKGRHDGMPPMYKVREEFPEMSKAEFDSAMLKAERDRVIELKTFDDLSHAKPGELDGILRMPLRVRPGNGPDAFATKNYGYAVANKEPSGTPWSKAKSESDHDAARLAAEDAHIEAMDRWSAHDEALDEAHGSAMSAWKSKKAAAEQAHAAELSAWEQEQASAAATHAAMLDKAAEFARAQKALKLVDDQVEKAAKGIIEGAPKPSVTSDSKIATPYRSAPKPSATLRERYETAKDEVERIVESQEAILNRAAVPSAYMPKTAASLSGATLRAASYLLSTLPAPVDQQTLGAPMPDLITDADMHKFLEKFDAVKNPMSALRDFARGRITQNKAEAIRFVSPEIFAQLQEEALGVVVDRQAAGKPLPFEARQRMAILLNIQTDPSQAPSMAAHLLANLGSAPAMGGANGVQGLGPKVSPGRAVKLPASLSSGSRYDRLEKR